MVGPLLNLVHPLEVAGIGAGAHDQADGAVSIEVAALEQRSGAVVQQGDHPH